MVCSVGAVRVCDWLVLCRWLVQGEATRRREQELVKLRKDVELLTVQHESSEASLRKRHQEAINELNDQLEQLSKNRNKSVPRLQRTFY